MEPASDRRPPPRIAVVGCGPWGQNLIRNLAELGALSALVNRRNAETVARTYSVPLVGFRDALADPAIDGVVIATPPLHHPELATQALEAGKHVYVEKAFALSSEAARAVADLAERTGRCLMVGHILQYHPAFREALKIVRSGALGELLAVQSSRLSLGRVRRDEEDVAWSLGPHDVSMLHALLDGEPEVVSAVAGYHLRPDVADIVHAHLEFPGGVAAHLSFSWYHPAKEQKLVVTGREGMLVFDDVQPWERKLLLYRHRTEQRDGRPQPVAAAPEPVALEPAEPLREEMRHFLTCVETRQAPRTNGAEALRVVRTIEEIRSAMRPCGRFPAA